MATFVEYSEPDVLEGNLWTPGVKLTSIGYLRLSPEKALRELLPSFYVVDYLGITIPSRNKYSNYNQGLRISPVNDGIGLVGTIEMLSQNSLFQSCEHKPFSDVERSNIVKTMKSNIRPWMNREPLRHREAENYALIFDALGHPISLNELIEFTTPEDYYKPLLNGGINS